MVNTGKRQITMGNHEALSNLRSQGMRARTQVCEIALYDPGNFPVWEFRLDSKDEEKQEMADHLFAFARQFSADSKVASLP